MDAAKAAEIADAGKFPAEVRDQVIAILLGLWETFVKEDATLVEVNPLVKDATARSSRWTARSPSTRTPHSGTPVTVDDSR